MEFGQNVPRVVKYSAITFLNHPSCSSGIIQAYLDHYTVGLMVYMSGDYPFIK